VRIFKAILKWIAIFAFLLIVESEFRGVDDVMLIIFTTIFGIGIFWHKEIRKALTR
jgi:hypothetical protein